jgi:hypothetical protein
MSVMYILTSFLNLRSESFFVQQASFPFQFADAADVLCYLYRALILTLPISYGKVANMDEFSSFVSSSVKRGASAPSGFALGGHDQVGTAIKIERRALHIAVADNIGETSNDQ